MIITFNGYEIMPAISDEWVKQLIHDYVDNGLDFYTMKIYRTPFEYNKYIIWPMFEGMRRVKAIVEHAQPMVKIGGCYADSFRLEEEIIDIETLVDKKNKEYHLIGCGRKSNKVFVGCIIDKEGIDRIDIT